MIKSNFTILTNLILITAILLLSGCLGTAPDDDSNEVKDAIFVDINAPGPTYDGSTWGKAYNTIQEGIDAAAEKSGTQVWVAEGNYIENISLVDGVLLYGGFAGNETELSQRNWSANTTIIDGNSEARVVTVGILITETRIDGFTIRNGNAVNGGGIYRHIDPLGLLTIANNTITENTASTGGGISLDGNSKIINNVITGNTATQSMFKPGGGIYCDGDSPVIEGNIISNNVGLNGVGIYLSQLGGGHITNNTIINNNGGNALRIHDCQANLTITNNIISDNDGRGISAYRSDILIINNTISNNIEAGIDLTDASPTIANNIIAFNITGISGHTDSDPSLHYNCVYSNDTVNYENITPGINDLSSDPLLTNDYHIRAGSSCRDAGDNSFVETDWLDIDNEPRINNNRVDIGADEYN